MLTQFDGLNTYIGAMSLPVNFSPDMLNLISFPGRLKYRGGMLPYAALLEAADQAFFFYDDDGDKHFAVFANGNLYDVESGTAVLIDSAIYTPGVRIGVVALNGTMYFSTWDLPLWEWDPATSTIAAVVQVGPNDMNGSPYLLLYTNAIVALGVQYDASDQQPTVMGWSNINDPTTWNAANSQAVGPLLAGAYLSFGVVLGIADTGVPPTRTFVVGRSDKGLVSYTGALGSLQENAINFPVGCNAGESAVFCPGADGFGVILLLGNDGQFWKTNGINAVVASLDIQNLVQTQFTYAPPGTRFYAGYNPFFSYYFCNVNGYQFAYKWDTERWHVFRGWPNGIVINAPDLDSIPSLFIASSSPGQTGYFQIGIPNTDDDGTMPEIYYKTAWLNAGDPELLKIWRWIAIEAADSGTVYAVSARGNARANDGSYMQSSTLYFGTTGTQVDYFTLNVSLLDGPDVLAPDTVLPGPAPIIPPTSPVLCKGMLACPFTPEDDSYLRGIMDLTEAGGGSLNEDLKATACQFTVAYSEGTKDFDVTMIQPRYLSRGYRREGGWQYESAMGVTNPRDPFIVNNLSPLDPDQGEPGPSG